MRQIDLSTIQRFVVSSTSECVDEAERKHAAQPMENVNKIVFRLLNDERTFVFLLLLLLMLHSGATPTRLDSKG